VVWIGGKEHGIVVFVMFFVRELALEIKTSIIFKLVTSSKTLRARNTTTLRKIRK